MKRSKRIEIAGLGVALLLGMVPAFADEMMSMPGMDHGTPQPGSSQEPMPDMPMAPVTLTDPQSPDPHAAQQAMMITNMLRQGSGTSWQPTDNPMLMKMGQAGPWMTMLHWDNFFDYDNQGGSRGRQKLFGSGWVMGQAMRPVGERGIFQLRAMLSNDAITEGPSGYPLLFQTGESFHNRPLIDYQHPHDLFMELSAQYFHQLGEHTWGWVYAAPVGEPALGPVAAPHRYSALMNPETAIGHHILDSTHIAFGVITTGLILHDWQLEASVFNGREPDQNRFGFDFGSLNSFSGRLSYMPNAHWAMQVSHGFLNHPEALDPNNINRSTASVQYFRTWEDGWWANLIALGHNFESGPDDNLVALESMLNFKNRNYVYSRVENIERHGLLPGTPDTAFNVTAFTLGAARQILQFKGIPLMLGAQISLYAKPGSLDQAYGDFPVSFNVYLHTNAPRMNMMSNRAASR